MSKCDDLVSVGSEHFSIDFVNLAPNFPENFLLQNFESEFYLYCSAQSWTLTSSAFASRFPGLVSSYGSLLNLISGGTAAELYKIMVFEKFSSMVTPLSVKQKHFYLSAKNARLNFISRTLILKQSNFTVFRSLFICLFVLCLKVDFELSLQFISFYKI